MKANRLVIFLLLFSGNYLSQQKDSNFVSVVDVGVGFGLNYGLLGAQAILGYNGNGVLVAGGYFGGEPTFELGLQLNYEYLFLNVGYGSYAVSSSPNSSNTSSLIGIIVAGGLKYKIPKNKNIFLQLGGSFATGDGIRTPTGYQEISKVSIVVGLGYQILRIKQARKKQEH